jgi:hypothetical protein
MSAAEPSATPLAICLDALRLLDMTGGGISVMTSAGHRGTVCATDDVAAAIEDLQFRLGEGPCVDAFHRGPVMIADLNDPKCVGASPWPQFVKEASAAGARALFALPLQIGAIRVGAFDLYRDRPGLLTDARLSLALTLADAAATSLLADRHGLGIDLPLEPAASSSSYHAEVHQATGMLSVQLGISLDDAFVRVRAFAFATERSINEVARDVVEGRLGLDDEDRGQK